MSERARAVQAARGALDELKRASGDAPDAGVPVEEVEQLAAAARRAVAVVGRLERHQSSGTSGAAEASGPDDSGSCDGPAAAVYESLRDELRRESMRAMGAAVERQRRQLFSPPAPRPSDRPATGAEGGGGGGAKGAEDTAAQVTAGLRRARWVGTTTTARRAPPRRRGRVLIRPCPHVAPHRARGVLMAEVERTDAAMGVMDDSISALGNINSEFGGSMKSGASIDGRTAADALPRRRWFGGSGPAADGGRRDRVQA